MHSGRDNSFRNDPGTAATAVAALRPQTSTSEMSSNSNRGDPYRFFSVEAKTREWNWSTGLAMRWGRIRDGPQHIALEVLLLRGLLVLTVPYFSTSYAMNHVAVHPELSRKKQGQVFCRGAHVLHKQ